MVTSSDHFAVLDGVISPQPWAQYRMVKTEKVGEATRTYVSGGSATNKHDHLQTVQTHWTNNSPIDQYVYGMVSHGGSQVTLQGASRGYIIESHGVEIGDGDAIAMEVVSKFGTGINRGNVIFEDTNSTAFVIGEVRNNSNTVPLLPGATGWFKVAPGEKFNARVETLFHTEYWEDIFTPLGPTGTENIVRAGELSISLYAIPVIGTSTIGDRDTPTMVGAPTSIVSTAVPVTIAKPEGTIAGDVLIAIVANQFGLGSDIQPPDATWVKKANVNGTLAGWEDVHLKVFLHLCDGNEPATFRFSNGSFAEMTIHMIALRGAEQDFDDGWAVASRFTSVTFNWHTFRWNFTPKHWAPSIDRDGQVLIASSYFSHSLNQQDPVYGPGQNFIITTPLELSDTGHYRQGMIYRFEVPGRITELAFYRHPNSAVQSRQIQLYKNKILTAVSEPTREHAGLGGWIRAKLTHPVEVKANEQFTVVYPEPGGRFYWADNVPAISNGHITLEGTVISSGSTGTTYPQTEMEDATRFADLVFQPIVWGTGLTQEPPVGMEKLLDDNGGASGMATAIEYAPLPNPTGDRMFLASAAPTDSGNSITASILVPGARSGTLKS